ncbi:MAG: hypothetical protein ACXIVD_06385 [Salinarimonas sp.]
MFDVTPEEIALLNDTDLRELVGRLCEAELVSHGISPTYVTWGGNQTAPDGGLDVRVMLPEGAPIDGFVPRAWTGIQVKKSNMPRGAIINEMQSAGQTRPVIQSLANKGGSYIIASSGVSVSDFALKNRRQALREGLGGVENAERLHTDFYDRSRLATWVRCHPGLVVWVKEKVGHSYGGWRPYTAWSGAAEGLEAEYLLDDKIRLHFGKGSGAPDQPVSEAIDTLRDKLAPPGKMVRLVGLSGVGKTRLVQALFDDRIGTRPLHRSLAAYTDLSDNPDPQPTGFVSDLIANGLRAVVIVDNCPPDLHRRLSDLCTGSACTVSVLTVEYDVREDQPEGTEVVTLDTSSPELIERLVARRFPNLSDVDARTIAEASGGNARIAIALAETVGRSETIAGLTNDELFQRLFRQRHDPDETLLRAAQACSLVYSFHGEELTGDDAELPRLAVLADLSPLKIYRSIREIQRRNLIQLRSVWRAVLPHAIANQLAARALEDTPLDLIEQQLVTEGTERLARSFSRRLSFLNDSPRAVEIVERWLAPSGLLGDITTLNDLRCTMFENVAPVSPAATLAALERAGESDPPAVAKIWHQHRSILRSLAYDAVLFERSLEMLARAATQSSDESDRKEASDTFLSLFTIHLSGTHATIEQRIVVVERLLRSREEKEQFLGLASLERILEASFFNATDAFNFGGWSRDYGFEPKNHGDVVGWYGSALQLIARVALDEGILRDQLARLLARQFRGLWGSAHMFNELDGLARRLATQGFWREGWIACRQTLRFDKESLPKGSLSQLVALESVLRPSSLADRVRATVLGDRSGSLNDESIDFDDNFESHFQRQEIVAQELGNAVISEAEIFDELLPDLIKGGSGIFSFGRGLASGSGDPGFTWERLLSGLELVPVDQRDVRILRGFLAELWESDRDLAHDLLDNALDCAGLKAYVPDLHSSLQLDSRALERLTQLLASENVPIEAFRNLAYGPTTCKLCSKELRDFILRIAESPDGYDVAQEILAMRLFSDRTAKRPHEFELLEAGRGILQRITFYQSHITDHKTAMIAHVCLTGADAAGIAQDVIGRLKQAVAVNETSVSQNNELLKALLTKQPITVLDALFSDKPKEQLLKFRISDHYFRHSSSPMDAVSCDDILGSGPIKVFH